MGKCTFNVSWMSSCDSQGRKYSSWLKGGSNSHEGFCICCNCSFSVAKGFQGVTQHASTPKHQKNFVTKFSPTQLHFKVVTTVSEPTTVSESCDNQVSFYFLWNSVLVDKMRENVYYLLLFRFGRVFPLVISCPLLS